jgi:hypothetical protein
MKSKEFERLGSTYKFNLLCEYGVYLTERRTGSYRITLLQFQNFYVEIYFHLKKRCIKLIRSFTEISGLDEYLKEIDISELFYSS